MVKSPERTYLFPDKTINRLLAFCMYASCAMFFLILAIGTENQMLTVARRLGILGSSFLFSAVSWISIRRCRGKYPARLSLLMAAWLLLSQLFHFANGNIVHHYTQFLPVYLLAFPFAAITQEGDRQQGLKVLSIAYLSVSLLWVIYAGLLFLDRVPLFLQSVVHWDGPRLTLLSQANIGARGFMIGIALALGFSTKMSRTWAKCLLWIAAALLFICLALTNSRSTILSACLLIGGFLFFSKYKGGWLQLAAGIALVLAITMALFYTSQNIFQWHQQRMMNSNTALQQTTTEEASASQAVTVSETVSDSQAIAPDPGASPQSTFGQDLITLNSRTRIWTRAIQHILKNPSVLIWGSHTTELPLDGITVQHAHNAWLEVLMRAGLIGFVISLIFTCQALISSLAVLFSQRADLWKKTISLLLLAILLSSTVEPSLFFTTLSWNFVDFFFFGCLGYVLQWAKHCGS